MGWVGHGGVQNASEPTWRGVDQLESGQPEEQPNKFQHPISRIQVWAANYMSTLELGTLLCLRHIPWRATEPEGSQLKPSPPPRERKKTGRV